jgi:hypothetical protein
MPDIDERARLGAANNADIYELVFAAHGLGYRRDSGMFASADPPPPYYSSMTTLDPDDVARQRATIRELRPQRPGFGLKDGFRRLELAEEGFDILFEASWIWAPAERLAGRPADWQRVRTAQALERWEAAWAAGGSPADRRVFPPALLEARDLAFFGRPGGGGFTAGCIANLSAGCVGLSNVFGSEADRPFGEAASLASAFGDGVPVVGYERGAALEACLGLGFETVGRLRVWVSAA